MGEGPHEALLAQDADWDLFLHSMVVEGFHIPNPQIRLLPSEGLRLSIKDANIKISGRWTSKKNFL